MAPCSSPFQSAAQLPFDHPSESASVDQDNAIRSPDPLQAPLSGCGDSKTAAMIKSNALMHLKTETSSLAGIFSGRASVQSSIGAETDEQAAPGSANTTAAVPSMLAPCTARTLPSRALSRQTSASLLPYRSPPVCFCHGTFLQSRELIAARSCTMMLGQLPQ